LRDESVLGLSLTKILFTLLIIVVVWKGFGLVNQLARERQGELGRRSGQQPARPSGWRRQRTVDLVPCPRCGAYVDPGKGCSCGHPSG
jgi:hypothetical protein